MLTLASANANSTHLSMLAIRTYKKLDNYQGLVPINVDLKGQLHLAQGNTLGVRIPLPFQRPDRAAA